MHLSRADKISWSTQSSALSLSSVHNIAPPFLISIFPFYLVWFKHVLTGKGLKFAQIAFPASDRAILVVVILFILMHIDPNAQASEGTIATFTPPNILSLPYIHRSVFNQVRLRGDADEAAVGK